MTSIQEYTAEDAGVTRKDISPSALKVIDKLQKAGFDSYLVGGCVRDLMLGKIPKDFDIATAAHPEEIDSLFNNCRLIGRRFRLAHIRYGREIIEVATFRGHHGNTSKTSEKGMILRDNVYGTVEEDAIRRDLTINALYYDPNKKRDNRTGVIRDFMNSTEDIQKRKIRLIGDPEVRYKEDPVRMLRAVRFAAKLDFTIEKHSKDAIYRLANHLREIPAARLFEEIQKLFVCGHAFNAFQQLDDYQLLDILFPLSVQYYRSDKINRSLIDQALINTDQRLSDGKYVTPSFLLAVLLWAPMQEKKALYIQHKEHPDYQAMNQAAQYVILKQTKASSIPKRYSTPMREMWDLQARLAKRHGNRADALHQHPRFRASYDFLLLREQSGEIEPGLGEWWTKYQEVDTETKQSMVRDLKQKPKKRKRSPRKPRSDSSQNNESNSLNNEANSTSSDDQPLEP